MAEAESFDEVTETKTVVIEPARVVLTLTPEEAIFVAGLVAHVSVTNAAAQSAETVYDALAGAGVDYYGKIGFRSEYDTQENGPVGIRVVTPAVAPVVSVW